jgi:hypothetical protein
MGESASKEHLKNFYGTSLDDFLEIDARLYIFIFLSFCGFAVTADLYNSLWTVTVIVHSIHSDLQVK